MTKNSQEQQVPVFECKCCGHCCHGEATVSVSQEEQAAIAAYLNLDLQELIDSF